MKKYLVIFLAIWLTACARQSSPTGGLKDVNPPEIIFSDPPNYSINFNGNSFALTFDEYFEIKDFNSQIIVSPTLKSKTNYRVKKKTLIVTWDDTLKANTTYQFIFGKAIQDLNEGNQASNLRFVFSTGDYLDSLHITGFVKDAITGKSTGNAGVMLYLNTADSVPIKSLPEYYTLTDTAGFFNLDYLPPGQFKLFALSETNNNYQYDGPPEQIAFANSLVQAAVRDSTSLIALQSFIESDTIQYLVDKTQRDFGYHVVVFSIAAKQAEISFINPKTDTPLESKNYISKGHDTLYSWVDIPVDSEIDELEVLISDGATYRDTLYWNIETDPRFREKAKFLIRSNTVGGRLPLGRNFALTFNNPITQVDSNMIYFYEDSIQFFPTDFSRRDIDRNLTMNFPLKEKSTYEVRAKAGAFRDVFGSYSDSLAIRFSLQDESYYGAVHLHILDSTKTDIPRLLEIRDSKNNILIRETFNREFTRSLKRLEPGKYQMRLVYDSDQNEEWTTGKYSDKRQPERILTYGPGIDVRSNWELDINWFP